MLLCDTRACTLKLRIHFTKELLEQAKCSHEQTFDTYEPWNTPPSLSFCNIRVAIDRNENSLSPVSIETLVSEQVMRAVTTFHSDSHTNKQQYRISQQPALTILHTNHITTSLHFMQIKTYQKTGFNWLPVFHSCLPPSFPFSLSFLSDLFPSPCLPFPFLPSFLLILSFCLSLFYLLTLYMV